jgi:hypothetical protein
VPLFVLLSHSNQSIKRKQAYQLLDILFGSIVHVSVLLDCRIVICRAIYPVVPKNLCSLLHIFSFLFVWPDRLPLYLLGFSRLAEQLSAAYPFCFRCVLCKDLSYLQVAAFPFAGSCWSTAPKLVFLDRPKPAHSSAHAPRQSVQCRPNGISHYSAHLFS